MSDFRSEARELKVSVKGLPTGLKPRVRRLDDKSDLCETNAFSWRDDVLMLRKAEPGSVVFAIDFIGR